MAKKVFENDEELDTLETFDEEVKVAVYEPRIKQLTRKVGPNFVVGQVDLIEMVDDQLSAYINNGWKLFSVTRLATEPEGYTLLYVLTKD